MRRIIVVTVVLALVSAGVYYALASQGKAISSAAPTATPTGNPALQNTGGEVVAGAELLPLQSVELSLAATGIVSQVLVSQGDTVKKGQVLVRVDSQRHAAVVAQAQGTLDSAKAKQAASHVTLARAQAALELLKSGPREERKNGWFGV